jgi:hypothetical protein
VVTRRNLDAPEKEIRYKYRYRVPIESAFPPRIIDIRQQKGAANTTTDAVLYLGLR